jgi:hypothetical protein
MRIRTTVVLDEDVLESVRAFSRQWGIPFRQALNDLVRRGLAADATQAKQPFHVEPQHLGYRAGLNYDDVIELLEHLEGPAQR